MTIQPGSLAMESSEAHVRERNTTSSLIYCDTFPEEARKGITVQSHADEKDSLEIGVEWNSLAKPVWYEVYEDVVDSRVAAEQKTTFEKAVTVISASFTESVRIREAERPAVAGLGAAAGDAGAGKIKYTRRELLEIGHKKLRAVIAEFKKFKQLSRKINN